MAKKKKYYVVWKGRKKGIFSSWDDCLEQVKGYKDAQFKSFKSLEEAQRSFELKSSDVIGKEPYEMDLREQKDIPDMDGIAVDAACSNNPGILEYRGVWIRTKEEIFHEGPFPEGTINIGEFLAIVEGLRYLKNKQKNLSIYSDSNTALAWIKKKKANTLLLKNEKNRSLFKLVEEAEGFLKRYDYKNKILKWQTDSWGEIPADFGRK